MLRQKTCTYIYFRRIQKGWVTPSAVGLALLVVLRDKNKTSQKLTDLYIIHILL